MSTLTAAQEERVTRAIEWALTEPAPTRGSSLARADDGGTTGCRPSLSAGSVSVPRRHQLCVFCGAPGSRLCCDCDDLPALDYGT